MDTLMAEKIKYPASREVRLAEGVTQGWTEDLLFQAHTGTTSELVPLMAQAELLLQHERSLAAEAIGALLLSRMTLEGYLTADAIKQVLQTWHEEEVL